MPGRGDAEVLLRPGRSARSASSASRAAISRAVVAQVEPQVGGDLVVAAAAGPQLAAERDPARSSRPRSSAVCTSSSAAVGAERAGRQARSRLVQRGQQPGQLIVVEQPGLVQHPRVRAGGEQVVGASRQSNCTLTDSRASASAGPDSNRPPHSRTAGACCSGTVTPFR